MKASRQAACLEEAMAWCCRRRKDAPPDADIWHLWFHWQGIKGGLLAALTQNRYRLSAMQIVGRGRQRVAIWSAQDAVVLKWVAMQLHDSLPVHPLCEHHKGHGGGRHSVHKMARSLKQQGWSYVCRTDIQGFYGHIRRGPLMRQLKRHVSDPVLLNLVRQYLHYSVERGGEFYTPRRGICRGCALSPLLAGFCLWAMDTYYEAQQPALRYVRYMNDIVIFTRTRWHLRRAVRTLNAFFASGGYRQHPDKTFIGKTDKGFDWMGIQFNGSGITGVAPRALTSHRERCRRLYEQAWRYGKKKTRARVAEYVKRWTIWRTHTMHQTQCSGTRTPERRPKRPGGWDVRLTRIILASTALLYPPTGHCGYPLNYSSTISADGSTSGVLTGIPKKSLGIRGPDLTAGAMAQGSATTDDGLPLYPVNVLQTDICLSRSGKSRSDSTCPDGIIVHGLYQTSIWYDHVCLVNKVPGSCGGSSQSTAKFREGNQSGLDTSGFPPGFWVNGVACPTCSASATGYNPEAGSSVWTLGAGTDLASGGTFSGSIHYQAFGDNTDVTLTVRVVSPAPNCDLSGPGSVTFGDHTTAPGSGVFSFVDHRPLPIQVTCSNVGTGDVGRAAVLTWSGADGTSYISRAWKPGDAGTDRNYPTIQLIRPDGSMVVEGGTDVIITSLVSGTNTGALTYDIGLSQGNYGYAGPMTSPGSYHWALGYNLYLN